MLVDQDGNRPVCGQLLQNLADRALPINDRVAAARADAFEHVVQYGLSSGRAMTAIGCTRRASAIAPTSQ